MLPQIQNLIVAVKAAPVPGAAFHSHSDRRCCRCRLPLTDAASMEVGIGPICRKLDNTLLARAIPSDVLAARKFFELVDVTALLPGTVATLLDVEAALHSDLASTVSDWRTPVKQIEWVLSYGENQQARHALTGVVGALGYIGLSALWNGKAATGKSHFVIDGGRVYLFGPRNKAGNATLKKITGWKFHKSASFADSKPSWSFPMAQWPQVRLAALTHWPNLENLPAMDQAWKDATVEVSPWVEAAKAITPAPVLLSAAELKVAAAALTIPTPLAKPVVPAQVTQPKPVASITALDGKLHAKTPYNPGFVEELKTLPWKDRTWDLGLKIWRVAPVHQKFLVQLFEKYFHFTPAVDEVTSG